MNAFSFCIYGKKDYYYNGLIENIKLIKEYYPDYLIYIYVGNDSRTDLIEQMSNLYDKIVWRYTNEIGAINMVYRFFAIDESSIKTIHVRDADSRVHERDRWAIDTFMKSDVHAYTIRDNVVHDVRMMGGLWGCKKLSFSIQSLFQMYRFPLLECENVYGYDQQFLSKFLYPYLIHSFMVFTNYHTLSDLEKVVPFPDTLRKDIFCGMPE
jgi:hypothetical protein